MLGIAVVTAASTLQAQGPQLDSLFVGTANRYVWRGEHRGDAALGAGVHLSIAGGPDARTWQWTVAADGAHAFEELGARPHDHLQAHASVIYHLSDDDSRLWMAAGGYAWPSLLDGRRSTAEIAVGGQVRLPWFPERPALLSLDAGRAIGASSGAYVEAGLRLDYKVMGPVGAYVELTEAWSSIPSGDLSESRAFAWHATSVDLWCAWDFHRGDLATLRLEPLVGAIWSSRNHDHNLFQAALRFVLVH